jgi:hypothetical protein
MPMNWEEQKIWKEKEAATMSEGITQNTIVAGCLPMFRAAKFSREELKRLNNGDLYMLSGALIHDQELSRIRCNMANGVMCASVEEACAVLTNDQLAALRARVFAAAGIAAEKLVQ